MNTRWIKYIKRFFSVRNLKIFVSLILIITLIISSSISFNAVTVYEEPSNSATYTDSLTGDIITVEEVANETAVYSLNNDTASVYQTQISRNGILEETLMIDWENNKLTHVYPDGTILIETLSDIVTVEPINTEEQLLGEKILTDSSNTVSNSGVQTYASTDYIDNEPFEIGDDGYQIPLNGTYIYTGYRAMGCRGGFDIAPDIYGYLQRHEAGLCEVKLSNLFSFSAGTVIGTAASIILAFCTSQGLFLALSVIIACLGPVIDVVTYDWSVQFQIRSYRWNYDVRINSNYGPIVYETYRIKDYVKSYAPDTGKVKYEYRGSDYDEGMWATNTQIIYHAIHLYVVENSSE